MCFKGDSRKFQGCSRKVFGCFKEVSMVLKEIFKGCSNGVLSGFQECLKEVQMGA